MREFRWSYINLFTVLKDVLLHLWVVVLCAAIAWASEREERARDAIETDRMVDRLRRIASGEAKPGAR